VLLRCRQRNCLGHRLRTKAAAVIYPALGIKPLLGENRLAAGVKVADPIGDPLVCARRAVIRRAVAILDRPEADDLGERADRLQQGAAGRTEVADEVARAGRAIQARLTG
jgi:hypothetical protein